jgi:hypothetical protein
MISRERFTEQVNNLFRFYCFIKTDRAWKDMSEIQKEHFAILFNCVAERMEEMMPTNSKGE